MASVTLITDDITGEDGAITRRFALGNEVYEIDLTDETFSKYFRKVSTGKAHKPKVVLHGGLPNARVALKKVEDKASNEVSEVIQSAKAFYYKLLEMGHTFRDSLVSTMTYLGRELSYEEVVLIDSRITKNFFNNAIETLKNNSVEEDIRSEKEEINSEVNENSLFSSLTGIGRDIFENLKSYSEEKSMNESTDPTVKKESTKNNEAPSKLTNKQLREIQVTAQLNRILGGSEEKFWTQIMFDTDITDSEIMYLSPYTKDSTIQAARHNSKRTV